MASAVSPIASSTVQSLSSRVTVDNIERAINSLLKWKKSRRKSGKTLDQEDYFYVVLTLKKTPGKSDGNPHQIPLPNPLQTLDSSLRICLIVDDRSKFLNADSARKKIDADNIPISKILKFSKLKSDYKSFEDKHSLIESYDIFFADKRIIFLLPKLLGKRFSKKKVPLAVDLRKKNWKEQMSLSCRSSLLHLRSGTCSIIKVASISQERDKIVNNVVSSINEIAQIIPKKWANIRSFHLKLLESVALPIYPDTTSENR